MRHRFTIPHVPRSRNFKWRVADPTPDGQTLLKTRTGWPTSETSQLQWRWVSLDVTDDRVCVRGREHRGRHVRWVNLGVVPCQLIWDCRRLTQRFPQLLRPKPLDK